MSPAIPDHQKTKRSFGGCPVRMSIGASFLCFLFGSFFLSSFNFSSLHIIFFFQIHSSTTKKNQNHRRRSMDLFLPLSDAILFQFPLTTMPISSFDQKRFWGWHVEAKVYGPLFIPFVVVVTKKRMSTKMKNIWCPAPAKGRWAYSIPIVHVLAAFCLFSCN